MTEKEEIAYLKSIVKDLEKQLIAVYQEMDAMQNNELETDYESTIKKELEESK